MADTPFDTEQQTPPPFPPHGRVRLRIEGRLLLADADGPFNVELLQIIRESVPALTQQLLPLGRWGNFCEYHGSAMATPEALQVLNALLQASGAHATAPACTAYVIGPTVEGAGLMEAIYERAFTEAGLRFRAFSDAASAKNWLLAELAALGPAEEQPPSVRPELKENARPAAPPPC